MVSRGAVPVVWFPCLWGWERFLNRKGTARKAVHVNYPLTPGGKERMRGLRLRVLVAPDPSVPPAMPPFSLLEIGISGREASCAPGYP